MGREVALQGERKATEAGRQVGGGAFSESRSPSGVLRHLQRSVHVTAQRGCQRSPPAFPPASAFLVSLPREAAKRAKRTEAQTRPSRHEVARERGDCGEEEKRGAAVTVSDSLSCRSFISPILPLIMHTTCPGVPFSPRAHSSEPLGPERKETDGGAADSATAFPSFACFLLFASLFVSPRGERDEEG